MKYDCINGGEEMGITFKYEVVPKKGRKIKNGIKKVKRVFNNPKITPHDAYNAFLSFLTEYLESNFCVFGYSNIKKETYFLRIRDFKRIDDLKIPTALWCKPNPNTNRFNIENEKCLYYIPREIHLLLFAHIRRNC